MFCDRCGTRLAETERFCPTCGKALAPAAPGPAETRISGHLRILGILWLAFSAVHLIPGVILLGLFRHGGGPGMPFFAFGVVRVVALFLLGAAVAGLMAGWGLLEHQPWARLLALVLAFVNLISVPFGTVLAAYTLWVLMPASSEAEYRRLARVS